MLVPLTNSDKMAIVDDEFREEVMCQNWCLRPDGYVRSVAKSRFDRVFLHHLIVGQKLGFEIDHINGDKLDCRDQNLRHVTHAQQMQNRAYCKNKLGHVGIKRNQRGRYEASIEANGQWIHLGVADTLEEAIKMRKWGTAEFHGEYARKDG